jgi:hypothetical protein
MKSIEKSGTSSVIFRLNKISQYVTPYYIFELENQNSKIKTLFTSTDVSTTPLQYNEFLFVNGVTYSATQSRFNLDSGNYFLSIYETQFKGITALGSASSIALYYGELNIKGDLIPDTIYLSSPNDTTTYFE